MIRVLRRLPDFSGDTLISYDTTSWEATWGIRTVPFNPATLAIGPDSKFVAIGGEVRNPKAWPFSTPQPIFGNPPLPDTGLIAIVDISQRKIVRTIPQQYEVKWLAWNQDGKHIAFGTGAGVGIHDAHSGEQLAFEAMNARHHIRYTSDGKYFIESGFGEQGARVRIWDGQHQHLLQEIKAIPGCIAVSKDGRYLAMGGDRKIIVWQLK